MKVRKIEGEVVNKMSDLIIAGFGLAAALAWNSAIQSIFNHFLSGGNTLVGQIVYALTVTVIAVFITIWVSKIISKK